jgi:hypothetical protein
METEILQNKKARQIQQFYRLSKVKSSLNEFRKMELKSNAKTKSFADFTRIIRKKDIIQNSEKFLTTISKNSVKKFKMNPRILLTSYIINYYTNDVMDKSENRHPIDNGIIEWSQSLIELLEEKPINTYTEINKMSLFINNFESIFNQWKSMDKNRTIERIIISYNNRSEHIEILQSDKELDKNQKETALNELKNQREQLLYDIRLINPNFDIEYLKQNYKTIYNELKKNWAQILKSTGNTMKKAYYDMVSAELKNGNSKPIYDLFNEITKRILNITPQKRLEPLAKKMDEVELTELLCYGDWNEDLNKHINFLGSLIIMFGAAADDKENMEWKAGLNHIYKFDYNEKLPEVLIQMEEKLDRIYQLIIQANEQMNKK